MVKGVQTLSLCYEMNTDRASTLLLFPRILSTNIGKSYSQVMNTRATLKYFPGNFSQNSLGGDRDSCEFKGWDNFLGIVTLQYYLFAVLYNYYNTRLLTLNQT